MIDKLINFRTITPIYNFVGDCFELSGNHRDAEFKIRLIFIEGTGNPLTSGLSTYIENESKLNKIYEHIFLKSYRNFQKKTPLIIDCFQIRDTYFGNTLELSEIESSIIQSLKLLTTKSIIPDCSYTFKVNIEVDNEVDSSINTLLTSSRSLKPYFIYHGDRNSELGNSIIDSNISTTVENLFKILLQTKNEIKNDYIEILNLAISYYNTSICLDIIEHSFLLQVVIFELIFKCKETDKLTLGIKRYKKLTNYKISENFRLFNNNSKDLIDIRNKLAHGKSYEIEENKLKEVYNEMHLIIRKSISIIILKHDELYNKSHDIWFKLDSN
jgi:hypothetical protein